MKEDLQNLKQAKDISEYNLALTAAFVQQDQIQREVSRWFSYLTDKTSSCIDKKSAC